MDKHQMFIRYFKSSLNRHIAGGLDDKIFSISSNEDGSPSIIKVENPNNYSTSDVTFIIEGYNYNVLTDTQEMEFANVIVDYGQEDRYKVAFVFSLWETIEDLVIADMESRGYNLADFIRLETAFNVYRYVHQDTGEEVTYNIDTLEDGFINGIRFGQYYARDFIWQL